jgi:ribosomal protein S18 acetylase RimI-like enzyme
VVHHVAERVESVEAGPGPELGDARILKNAVRESILTSPGSFLKTVVDVETMADDRWDKEIDTSTWVVVQQSDKVVGIAVARWPDEEMDRRISVTRARFIESVWIAPEFRGGHMGERLVNYLMDIEHARTPAVRHFMLWVFKSNENAIQLYKRMGFKRTGCEHTLSNGTIELRYEYVLPNPSSKKAARRLRANAVGRAGDRRQYGITYRVLGRTSGSSD